MLLRLAGVILVNWLIQVSGFRSNTLYRCNHIGKGRTYCNAADPIGADVTAVGIEEYLGPNSDFDDMEAGCSIADLGIQVMIGPSLIGEGRGLFTSILDEVDEVLLPAGTPICGYSKGVFKEEAGGDKSVAYLFSNPYTGVIFEKKLMPLLDAIGIVEDRINKDNNVNITTSIFKSINNKIKKFKVAESVIGHVISFDEENSEIIINPDLNYSERYFIPDEETESTVWGPGRLGMYANDLAYYDGVDEETYNRNSPELNVLQIAWRLELINQTLVPTWPVVITLCDVLFKNRIPMELGLQYSWRYWKSVQELIRESSSEIVSSEDNFIELNTIDALHVTDAAVDDFPAVGL